MKLSALIFFSSGCFLLFASKAEGKLFDSGKVKSELGNAGELDVQHGETFRCPFPFGNFGNSEDCSKYYVCFGGMHTSKKCGMNFRFDIFRRICLPGIFAFCGNNGKKSTNPPPETTPNPNEKFRCPSFSGTYSHSRDCSKYYTCRMFMPSEKTCPEDKLFNAVKSSCQPAKDVHCGNRQRPDKYSTPVIDTGSISTNVVTNSPVIEVETDSPTDIEENNESPEPTGVVPTENISSTEKQRESKLLDGECEEGDVDCIIDNTGDPDDWFECPKNTGSYPHPKSNRLFIFCMNWIPSVTKCSPEMVFSEELETCVETRYFTF